MAFNTAGSGDRIYINDDSGAGQLSYYGSTTPPVFTQRSSTGNRIYLRWSADCCGHTSGFKLFFYCHYDNTAQSNTSDGLISIFMFVLNKSHDLGYTGQMYCRITQVNVQCTLLNYSKVTYSVD